MSINIKKYTKEQMAQMVEEAAERLESLKFENSTLTEQLKSQTAKTIALRNDLMAKTHSAEELKSKNAVLIERIEQMNGEAITRANELTNLKAEVQVFRNKLADTETALGRANAELGAAEGALGKMNDKIVRCEEYSRSLRGDVNKLQLEKIDAIMRANYAENHPWRNLLAWAKRKLARHE